MRSRRIWKRRAAKPSASLPGVSAEEPVAPEATVPRCPALDTTRAPLSRPTGVASPRPACFTPADLEPPPLSIHEQIEFSARTTIEQVEEGDELAPKFDEHGLLPVVTTAAEGGEVLMLGYMNEEALKRTIATGEAHYFSRSRQVLWHKGATSGLVQRVVELRIDDDQDAVWLRVEVAGSGASCHVGYRSCFFREVPVGVPEDGGRVVLQSRESEKTFDPVAVYGDAPNPTKL